MARVRRAKIVATLGPATGSEQRLEALLRAGGDVVRLNFSHGERAEHVERIRLVRAVAQRVGRTIAVLQDLQGPKVRVGRLAGGGPVELADGAVVTITTSDEVGSAARFSTTYSDLARDVAAGDPLLLDDGRLRLRVVSTDGRELQARVEHGGPLGEHKGINLPGTAISAPALTEKDRVDLKAGLEHGVDFVALSFIRTAAEVAEARAFVESLGARVPLIVKLEKPQAIHDLDAILAEADGVMVARGDLGVEMPTERVPPIQKMIIRKANRLGKPVITATQMLESMIESPSPTRAEATDVANAIWDGTDAVMLSAETAVGRYPVESVETMDRIVVEAERQPAEPEPHGGRMSHAHAMSHAARSLAHDLPIRAIICFTRSGRTAELLARDRPRVPILAFTTEPTVERRLALWWGVQPVLCDLPESTDAMIAQMERVVLQRGLVEADQSVVLVGAIPFRHGVHTNFLKLHHLG